MILTPNPARRVFAYPAAGDLRKGYDGRYGLVVQGLRGAPHHRSRAEAGRVSTARLAEDLLRRFTRRERPAQRGLCGRVDGIDRDGVRRRLRVGVSRGCNRLVLPARR